MIETVIGTIGQRTIQLASSTSELVELFWNAGRSLVYQVVKFRFRYRESLDQMFLIGVESLPVIVFSLIFLSLMLTIEFSYHMKLVILQDSLVPAFATQLVIREMGPVVTCLLLTSRVGAGIAAEVGTMKVTDQIDALKLLAIDPVEYLLIPRWVGCLFASLSLTVVSIALAMISGAFIATVKLGHGYQQYFDTMFLFSNMGDVASSLFKASVFGTIIPFLSCYHGFRCEFGAEGVGRATTAAVVSTSIAIIVMDFVLTYFLYAV